MTMPSGLVKGYLTSPQNLPLSSSSYTLNMSAAHTGDAIEVGDFIFIFLEASGSMTNANTPAPPTGFTELVQWQAMGTSTTTTWGLYVKRRSVGETNYEIPQININRTNIVSSRPFWVDGTDAADVAEWIIGTLKSRAASGGTVNTEALSVNTTTDDSMVFAFGTERTSASEVDANLTVSGTGWTKRLALLGSSASASTLTIASKGVATAGASGAATFTTTNTQATNGAALQVVIPAAAEIGGPPPTVEGQIYDGANVVAGHWYVAGPSDTILGLDFAGMIHPGSPTINDMITGDVFYCAHRGGSANWPEMTMQGYTQSALRGYDALELSLGRSSDGVWFGLHDQHLDRTSLGTGGTTLLASGMTWAAIQAYDVLPATIAPVNSDHQPYMELEELLDAYISSHVIFVDIKYAGSFRTELLNLLKTWPEWQEKIIAKFVPGNSNVSYLADARTAGFVTNAMFYDTDDFETYHDQADILGMEYGASGAVWDDILAFGKPVIGHVCQNQTNVNAALANGANGIMCGASAQVPRIPL